MVVHAWVCLHGQRYGCLLGGRGSDLGHYFVLLPSRSHGHSCLHIPPPIARIFLSQTESCLARKPPGLYFL